MTCQRINIFCFSVFLCVSGWCRVPRAEFAKPEHPVIRVWDRWDLLVIKFRENTDVRMKNHRLMAPDYIDLTPVHDLLDRYPDAGIDRLFKRPEAAYDHERQLGQARSGRDLADLNLYYSIRPASKEQAVILLEKLNALDIIECAYPEPLPFLANGPLFCNPINLPETFPPDFVDRQDYLEASPVGVNAFAAWSYPGGRGNNVRFIDIETGWDWDHIDLPEPFFEAGEPLTTFIDHGTSVIGEVCSLDNGFGTTGIAPETTPGGVAIDLSDYPDSLATWFDMASDNLDPGDIWLIELQAVGPTENPICMEYWQANYDAIAASTALGRICVEAAGNGEENLDDPVFEGRFDRSIRDSGAIVVAAGTPYDMQPESFTNYGSIINANGWGSWITTTGNGDLYGTNPHDKYTAEFGGTSGASPMIVGVCCCAQSIYKELSFGWVIDPVSLRTAITDTGAPQPEPVIKRIGPRPDLEQLLISDLFNSVILRTTRDVYSCDDVVVVQVVDRSVTGSPQIFAHSESEPEGEWLTLYQVTEGLYQIELVLNSGPCATRRSHDFRPSWRHPATGIWPGTRPLPETDRLSSSRHPGCNRPTPRKPIRYHRLDNG